MRLHRLIAILLLIESRGHIKAKDLASALEASVRTVYRDIEVLCQAGVPIAATTGPNGGIYFMEGYSAKLYNLQGDDAVNLYLSGIAAHEGDSRLNLRNTLLKLEAVLPPEYSNDVKIARERFYFDDNAWWTENLNVRHIETLRKSVWSCRKVKIEYKKANDFTSDRVLQPYGLVVKKMQWYMVAYCEKSESVKTFKCDRITNVELQDEFFMIPKSFSLESYWKDSEKRFKDRCKENEKYPVQIKIHRCNDSLLKKLEVYEAHEEGEFIIASVNMFKYEFACTDSLEMLWQIEVLDPVELRNYIKNKVKSAYDKYYSPKEPMQ